MPQKLSHVRELKIGISILGNQRILELWCDRPPLLELRKYLQSQNCKGNSKLMVHKVQSNKPNFELLKNCKTCENIAHLMGYQFAESKLWKVLFLSKNTLSEETHCSWLETRERVSTKIKSTFAITLFTFLNTRER